MSFYTSLTGVAAAQNEISVVSNNIANVGTDAFKKSRVEFSDLVTVSPYRGIVGSIGSGTVLQSVIKQFSQGNIIGTSNNLDMALSGRGFFITQSQDSSSQMNYTRSGSFSINNEEKIVDTYGNYLMGYPVHTDGTLQSQSMNDLIPLGIPQVYGDVQKTSKVDINVQLPSEAEVIHESHIYSGDDGWEFDRDDPSTYNKATSFKVYDESGDSVLVTTYYVKMQNGNEDNGYQSKWNTYVYAGDELLESSPVQVKNDLGSITYMNRFGETSTSPRDIDPTFDERLPHPLYLENEQNETAESTSAEVKSASVTQNNGFSFGDSDMNKVRIVTDPSEWDETFEATQQKNSSVFWGKNFFSLSVDGSTTVPISIRAGEYTGKELAEEMQRATNEAFGDDRYIMLQDTHVAEDNSVVKGNDIIVLDFFREDINGDSYGMQDEQGVSSPIVIDLLGNGGGGGTSLSSSGEVASDFDREIDKYELVELIQNRLNAEMNIRYDDFGKSNSNWVDKNTPPIKVGFDEVSQSLTFTVSKAHLGPNAVELESRINSFSVYGLHNGTNSLGIQDADNSQPMKLTEGDTFTGKHIATEGSSILSAHDQRYGMKIDYNQYEKKFEFKSSTTGEQSSISVSRPVLVSEDDVKPQIDSYDLEAITLSDGETMSFIFSTGGQVYDFEYSNSTGADLTGSALVNAIVPEFENWATTDNIMASSDVVVGNSSVNSEQVIDFSSMTFHEGESITVTLSGNVEISHKFGVNDTSLEGLVEGLKKDPNYDDTQMDVKVDGYSLHIEWKNPGVRAQASVSKSIEVTFTEAPNQSTGKLLIKAPDTGLEMSMAVRVAGKVINKEFVGASSSLGQDAVRIGSYVKSDLGIDDSGSNALLRIGGIYTGGMDMEDGVGLPSSAATVTGTQALFDMSTAFTLEASENEDRISFVYGGMVRTITLEDKLYTGDSLAETIQTRINMMVGDTGSISGFTANYNKEENRLEFKSGETGDNIRFSILGSKRFGLAEADSKAGESHDIVMLKQKRNESGELLYIDANGQETTEAPSYMQNWYPMYINGGEITFENGTLKHPMEALDYTGRGSIGMSLAMKYGPDTRQVSGSSFEVSSIEQDGYTRGSLEGVEIGSDGVISSRYSNSQTVALGKVALAMFVNTTNLQQVSSVSYAETSTSGSAILGSAGESGFGVVRTSSSERSNVDLTEELVNLISVQRNFQAGAKAIEINNTLSQTIINMRS